MTETKLGMNIKTIRVYITSSSLSKHNIKVVKNPKGVINEIIIFSINETQFAPDVIPWRKINKIVGKMNSQRGIKHTNQDTFTVSSNLHIVRNQNIPMKMLGIMMILKRP